MRRWHFADSIGYLAFKPVTLGVATRAFGIVAKMEPQFPAGDHLIRMHLDAVAPPIMLLGCEVANLPAKSLLEEDSMGFAEDCEEGLAVVDRCCVTAGLQGPQKRLERTRTHG